MANLTIPYDNFVAGTTIVSQQVDDNNTAIVNYINARNAGSSTWDAVASIGAFSTTLTSNQIVLGTTRTVTLTAPTPASTSRTHTIPDITADGTFAFLEGTQTFSGTKTFSAAVTIQASSSVTVASSGADLVFTVSNTSNTASAQAIYKAVVAGTTAADAIYQATVTGATSFTWGIDNSASDAWVLSSGTALGTNNAVSVNATTFAVAIRGTATNDSATAGFVGETQTAQNTSFTNYATTNTWQDITSISLTAGDWIVTGAYTATLNGSTTTQSKVVTSTFTGNTTTDHVAGDNQWDGGFPTAAINFSGACPFRRYSVSSTTTIYLKSQATFAAGNPQVVGRITAVRIR